MIRLSAALLTLASIALPCAASASEPATQTAPTAPNGAREEAKPMPRFEPELICRSIEIAGADAMPMVCMTAADWRRAQQ